MVYGKNFKFLTTFILEPCFEKLLRSEKTNLQSTKIKMEFLSIELLDENVRQN